MSRDGGTGRRSGLKILGKPIETKGFPLFSVVWLCGGVRVVADEMYKCCTARRKEMASVTRSILTVVRPAEMNPLPDCDEHSVLC
jgi:hypothetical protein